jgi:hypothetical protein
MQGNGQGSWCRSYPHLCRRFHGGNIVENNDPESRSSRIESTCTVERTTMPTADESKPGQDKNQAAEHVVSAHKILKELQQKAGEHPELGEAITRLEMALNSLAIQTGGLL